jgi:hypothetical protein
MNDLSITEKTISPSSDYMTDNVFIIKRKIEKYIISFTLHKNSNILSDLSKLQEYCDKLQKCSRDSIWIIK